MKWNDDAKKKRNAVKHMCVAKNEEWHYTAEVGWSEMTSSQTARCSEAMCAWWDEVKWRHLAEAGGSEMTWGQTAWCSEARCVWRDERKWLHPAELDWCEMTWGETAWCNEAKWMAGWEEMRWWIDSWQPWRLHQGEAHFINHCLWYVTLYWKRIGN